MFWYTLPWFWLLIDNYSHRVWASADFLIVWGQEGGVLGGRWGFLTRDKEDMVVPDVMNDIVLPQGVCEEGGDRKGTTLRAHDLRHGGHGCSWRHKWCFFFSQRNIPWKFDDDISIKSVSGRGASRRRVFGGRWGFLIQDIEDRVIPDVMKDVFLP